jgi:hypothetical protein
LGMARVRDAKYSGVCGADCLCAVSINVVLTQKDVEGKLEGVDLQRKGKDHAKDTEDIYERI